MASKAERDELGADADSPTEFTARAWLEILKRAWSSTGRHNIGFLAAGVAFFAFLSLAPGLALVVMVYGLVSDPQTIFENMVDLAQLLPAEAAMLINDQLANLIKSAAATRGIALIPAVAVALYGASGAARGIIWSLNVIYEEEERRSFLGLMALSLAIAAASVFVAVLGLLTASVTAFLEDASFALRLLTWAVAGCLATLTITLIYRLGPCRADAKWRWLTIGSTTATLLWLAGSVLFGWYVSIVSYESTYGSLGTVVALIMWMYVSAFALLLGAFLDAEAERQTARDSTTGRERPLGERGAAVADTSAALAQ